MKILSRVMEILTGVMVTQMYKFVKTHQTIPLKSVYFIVMKLYP